MLKLFIVTILNLQNAMIASDRVSVCNIFPEQAYMAGIFYECGVPILMQRFPDYCSKLNLETTLFWPTLAEEDALFNVDHFARLVI